MCSNSPILNGRFPFWEYSSRPPVSFQNFPFWVSPGLNISDFYEFFMLITLFINSMWKSWLLVTILASCVRCSRLLSWAVDPCQRKQELFCHKQKKRQGRVRESIQFVIFKQWKVLCNWIDYYWNSYCYDSGKFSQRQWKTQLSKDNLG